MVTVPSNPPVTIQLPATMGLVSKLDTGHHQRNHKADHLEKPIHNSNPSNGEKPSWNWSDRPEIKD
jgi:hypothetical protein